MKSSRSILPIHNLTTKMYPDGELSELIISKAKFERYEMKVSTGCRYLGGFIESSTLREKTTFWEKAITTGARASKKFPQIASLRRPPLIEWQYVHRTVCDAEKFFDGVEEAIA